MIIKKLIIAIFFLSCLNSCAQHAVLLGPAYTLASTGSVYQAGLTYGSDQAVTKLTGKSTGENFKEILIPKKTDSEFEKMVKKRIRETRKKLKVSSQ
jgi:hypothetical protein|tara:strand:- start:72 stop:362 length:291 start_codon:yes stop_codon:yes gene_type:complete